jgi:hypothetical protein
MLIPRHEKLHKLGCNDFKWGKKPVTTIQISRTVSEAEQWGVAVPVYAEDTREVLYNRTMLFATLLQERMEEYNEAWQVLADKKKEEALTKKALADNKIIPIK